MLLAVEGGGFFSASASGYSKFLSLILFGQKNEEQPMRVSPWRQYHLVGQEVYTATELASKKSTASPRCAIFICFGHPSTCQDGNSPPKVGPVLHSDLASGPSSVSKKGKNCTAYDATEENGRKVFLKSSIKKPPLECPVTTGNGDTEEKLDELATIVSKNNSNRKVQWTDACGRELVEIREFEPSDDGPSSDEESEPRCFRKCLCAIQ